MAPLKAEYIAAGANRHPSAADWWGGMLAFGTGWNVGIWDLGVQEEGKGMEMEMKVCVIFWGFRAVGFGGSHFGACLNFLFSRFLGFEILVFLVELGRRER